MNLILFPYLFTRYAGLPVECLNQLRFPDGNLYLEARNEARRNTEQCKLALCNLLYELIRQTPDPGQQKALLNLKRAVFNDRSRIESLVQKLQPALLEKTAACRAGLNTARAQEDRLIHQWQAVYEEKVAQDRSVIQQLSTGSAFRNGILLSSKDLYQQLPGFVQATSAALNQKLWRTEFSVLRYLTRMVYKTSPFSTFTYLGLTRCARQEEEETPLSPGPVQSRVRLNNKLLKRIKGLMEQHDGLNGLMYVGLNSSIRLEAEQFCYLLNSANIEILQRVPATPFHLLLYRLLQNRQEPCTLQALCQQLGEQVDAPEPVLKTYLLKLAAAGWLELNLQCSEISPDWDEQLLLFLQPHLDRQKAAQQLAGLLQGLQTAKQAFAAAAVAERCRMLEQVAGQLETTLLILEQEAGLIKQTLEERKALQETILERYRNGDGFEKLPYVPTDYRQEGIFYEDTYTPSVGTVPAAWIRSVTGKLDAFCQRLSGLDTRQAERQRLLTFFLQHYAYDEPVPLIQFYQAYYREKEQQARNAPPVAEAEPARQPEWFHAFTELLERCSRNEQGIHLSFSDLDGLPVSTLPVMAGAAFVQVSATTGDNEPLVVVNSLLPGMGKLSGRFLHLFDPEIGHLHKRYNLALAPDHLMLELNDGSGFNANIHPPLLDHEIKMPASHTIMEPQQQVPVHRIRVTCEKGATTLSLRDAATGKGIYAYDLCLETLTNRSKLYQLLSHFNPAPYISYYPIVYAIDQYYQRSEQNREVAVRPRITYEQTIVLRRKGWIVATAAMPQPSETATDSRYYLDIRQWLIRHGIPVQVFLFLQSAYLPKEPAGTSQLTRDDYKPQYISFDQLLLVKLFTRLLQRAGSHIYLEEVLPAIHPVADPAHRVTEHLLQWYNQ